MTRTFVDKMFALGLSTLGLIQPAPAHGEVAEVSAGYQYGLTYLPLMMMQEKKLVEKHAQATGLPNLKVDWRILSGPAPINDGLLSGRLHFGSVGVPSLVTLWSKTQGGLGVKAVGALTAMPMFLNTNTDRIKTIRDLQPKDRIALPSVKISVQGVTLQMAAAQAFGDKLYDTLDKQTIAMAHPDGFIALMSGKSEITAHFTAPPFQYQELSAGKGKVRTILNSYDVLGGPSTFTLVVATSKFRQDNPQTFSAWVKAFEEATTLINQDKKAAADLYLRKTKSNESLDEVLRQLNDPSIIFSLTPQRIMKYADFMQRMGTIKSKPDSWKDLCHANLHGLPGN